MNSSPDTPAVSVVMPVYNGGPLLHVAAQSILQQTISSLELIVVDDGSTDDAVSALEAIGDPRIRIIRHDRNMGLAKSFNDGIAAVRAPLIARMDADDIAEPNRLALQATFLRAHPEIGIVGSWVRVIDAHDRPHKLVKRPRSTTLLKWHALFSTPLIHPTVMARTSVMRENSYDESLQKSEDYELWSRLLWERHIQMATIARPLLRYRQWAQGTTIRLDSGRGTLSASNTLKNIRRYVSVSPAAELSFRNLKGDGRIRIRDWFRIMTTYARAMPAFMRREHPSFGEFAHMVFYIPTTSVNVLRRVIRRR